MQNILKISLGLFVAITGGAACSSAAQVQQSTAKSEIIAAAENSQGYSKPGANVKLSHNFSGKMNAGQVGDMTVKFIMPPTDGRVQVSFTTTDGLELLSGGDLRETVISKAAFLDAGQDAVRPQYLQFRAQEDGLYYVNAFVDVIYEGGEKRSRVITLPVSVGSGVAKPVNNGISLEDSGGRAVAVMSATETIGE